MDRKRVLDEVIEILAHKLHSLPQPGNEEAFPYENQALVPDVTKDPLDIQEVTMDLEDAFGVNFEDVLPGDAGMETIGKVVDFIGNIIQTREGQPVSAIG